VHQRHFRHFCRHLASFALLCALSTTIASAQQPGSGLTVVAPPERAPASVARPSELECSGQIETISPSAVFEIVGAEQEQEQHVFADGDIIYINGGSQQGLRLGDEFAVVRPRGQFRTSFTSKKGPLGVYTQEVGRVSVIEVKANVSIGRVGRTCDSILLGDLLRSVPQRFAPTPRPETNLERFADPTGKQTGRIVLARDTREMISKDQIVFIDLGTEDNIKVGDYLTIYRPAGTGNVTRFRDKEVTPNASRRFESERFRGGKFSNQSQRVKNPYGGTFSETVTTPEIRARRPAAPRKIVGEIVVLSVQGRTAAAVITRVAQEVHTGDFVELQ
jgi:hypothetical protein